VAEPTIEELIPRAIAALGALADLGETVEDEWQYVTDLRTVWGARLGAIAGAGGASAAPPGAARAIDTVLEEASLITDPHRAIDWLSTMPQVVHVALGVRPASPGPG